MDLRNILEKWEGRRDICNAISLLLGVVGIKNRGYGLLIAVLCIMGLNTLITDIESGYGIEDDIMKMKWSTCVSAVAALVFIICIIF